jgi:hypothetical protein
MDADALRVDALRVGLDALRVGLEYLYHYYNAIESMPKLVEIDKKRLL